MRSRIDIVTIIVAKHKFVAILTRTEAMGMNDFDFRATGRSACVTVNPSSAVMMSRSIVV